MYITRFTVKGAGVFPIDMLRYDSCHPADSQAVSALISQSREVYLVDLIQAHQYKAPGLTPARWASFGWQITHQHTTKV